MKNGKLFVFSAPSGSGKTTIIKEIFAAFPNLVFSVSATTRKPRGNETHGKDYFFLSEEEFRRNVEAGAFIEWERVFDYCYGTFRPPIEAALNAGNVMVLDLDVNGALSVKREFPDAVLIYIMPPSIGELTARLRERKTESPEEQEKRIKRSESELKESEHFDYIVINDELCSAVENTKKIFFENMKEESNYARKTD